MASLFPAWNELEVSLPGEERWQLRDKHPADLKSQKDSLFEVAPREDLC